MCFAVHPGGEEAETLALLRRKYGVETIIVDVTRGEGGDNAVGPELYDDLGVLRTAEARAAAAEIGARVRFLDFRDFGFCRSEDEAFANWGRGEMLRRVVGILRELKPQLVLMGYRGDGGSGQGRAVMRTLRDAFDAAAEPKEFPGEGGPWEVGKLFVACDPKEATCRVPVGEVDPVRGLSYAEMGRKALDRHRTQAAGRDRAARRSRDTRAYRLLRSRVEDGAESLLGGLSLPRREWLDEVTRCGTRAAILARIRKAADLPPGKRARALVAALGLDLRLDRVGRDGVPGDTVKLVAALRNGGGQEIGLAGLEVRSGWDDAEAAPPFHPLPRRLVPGAEVRFETPFTLPPDAKPNRPLRSHLRDGTARRAWVEVTARVRIPPSGETLPVRARRSVAVEPRLEIRVDPWSLFLRPTDIARVLPVLVRNHATEAFRGPIGVTFTGTDRLQAEMPEWVAVGGGEEKVVPVRIVPREGLAEGACRVTLSLGGTVFSAPFRVVDVGIPREVKVAVVTTLADEDRRAIEAMGIRPVLLEDRDLLIADLTDYDTIVLGYRAYGVRPVLRRVNRRLLDYVAAGGSLLVMGNRAVDWEPKFAPYPLVLGTDRVTREDAPIRFVGQRHRLLTFPNEISPEDFAGWRQERGRDFPSEWDSSRYQVILATSDPGRPEIPALLVTPFGKGAYIMTSLAWYRQLRIFNPAALRFLANAVSYSWRKD